jgi:NarL family two-component system response regulator YdfI
VTRVLIVAASAVVRAGLEAVISVASGLEVAGTVGSLLSLDRQPDADVLLIDLDRQDVLPPFSSEESGPDSPAMVLLGNEIDVSEALHAGARGVLPRDAEADEITAAVRAAAAGLLVGRPESLMPILPSTPLSHTAPGLEELTPREIEVLHMMAEGEGNKQIARRLGISEHTVKFHVGSILGKLGAASRTEAVTIGIRQGMILV